MFQLKIWKKQIWKTWVDSLTDQSNILSLTVPTTQNNPNPHGPLTSLSWITFYSQQIKLVPSSHWHTLTMLGIVFLKKKIF